MGLLARVVDADGNRIALGVFGGLLEVLVWVGVEDLKQNLLDVQIASLNIEDQHLYKLVDSGFLPRNNNILKQFGDNFP